MPVQVMGIFEKIFNWVYDKILSPVIDFVAGLITDLLEWLFKNILAPFLEQVFMPLMDIIGAAIMDFFFMFIYGLYCGLLELIDVVQYGFDVLIGLQDITYIDAAGNTHSTTLLNYIFYDDFIRNVLIAITLSAFGLALIFAIYSTARSALDFDFENKRPVSRILAMTLKTMISFLIVPLIVIAGLDMASVVLKQVAYAISGGNDQTIAQILFGISTMNAHRDDVEYSIDVNPWQGIKAGSMSYADASNYLHISQVDYFIGYIGGAFMLIIMALSMITFVRRIFDLVLLYITSPYFAATMVLDEGATYSKWRETFIGKVLMGFGSAIGMRVFLMLVPIIMDDRIQFSNDKFMDAVGGYVIKLLFVLGGLYAVYKSSSMLTSLVSAGVAADEQALSSSMMHHAMSGGRRLSHSLSTGRAGKSDKDSDKKKSDITKSSKLSEGKAAGSQKFTKTAGLEGSYMFRGMPKIDGAKGAAGMKVKGPDGKEGGFDLLAGVNLDGDYSAKKNRHIADVEDNSEAMHNLFAEPDEIKKPMVELGENDVLSQDYSSSMKSMFHEDGPYFEKHKKQDDGLLSHNYGGAMRSMFQEKGPQFVKPDRKAQGGNKFDENKSSFAEESRGYDIGAKSFYSGDVSQLESSVLDISANIKEDYTRSAFGGFSSLSAGDKSFEVPEGYAAFPRLVPTDKLESRIDEMRSNAAPGTADYYSHLADSAKSGSYSAPTYSNGVNSGMSFSNFGGTGKMNVPQGFSIVPEIVPISVAADNADRYSSGRNGDYFKQYGQYLNTQMSAGSNSSIARDPAPITPTNPLAKQGDKK